MVERLMEYDVPGWSTKQLVAMLKQMLFWEDPRIICFNLVGQPTDALLRALRGSETWNVFVSVAVDKSRRHRRGGAASSARSGPRLGFPSWIVTFQNIGELHQKLGLAKQK